MEKGEPLNEAYNWTSVCGTSSFIVWDESRSNFGDCFQKLVLNSGSFALLAIISSYYVGKRTYSLNRTRRQKLIIWCRILVTLCSLLVTVIQPCLLVLYAHLNLFWADIFLSGVQVLGWSIHLAYLNSLKDRLCRGTRGPRPVIIVWVLTLIFQSFYARTIWNAFADPVENESTDIFIIRLYRGLVTTQLVLQVLYLCSIFPRGWENVTQTRSVSHGANSSEYTPLLDSRVAYSNYSRFQEVLDPFFLGVAEDGINSMSYLTFYWVNLLMDKGSQGRIESIDDLYELPQAMKSETVFQEVQKVIMISQPLTEDSSENTYKKYSFLRALHKCFGLQFYAIGILKLVSDTFAFGGPLLLHELISFVDGEEESYWKGYAAGVGLCLTSLISCLCAVHFNYFMSKINIKLRAALITSIFRKIQHVSSPTLSQFSTGEVINMMSTDTDRVINFCRSFHAFWSLPIQFSVTLYLLYRQIGIAFLAGVGFAILLVPVNKLLASKIGQYSKIMMRFKDRRVQLMTELLRRIKTIKLNSLETVLKRRIMDERFREVKALAGRKYLDAACVYFWAATPVLLPIITFGTYSALGNQMKPANVFTSVALFNMLIVPLNAFPWAVNGLVEAFVSFKRIEKLMSMKEHDLNEYYTLVPDMSNKTSELQVVAIGANFSWMPMSASDIDKVRENDDVQAIQSSPSNVPMTDERNFLIPSSSTSLSSSELPANFSNRRRHPASSIGSASQAFDSEPFINPDGRKKFCLTAINIQLQKCHFIGIIGRVGSGKTALLKAILGELEKVSGIVAVGGLHQGFGLATQEPWLQNMTIKENIIFGQNFDPSRYRSVIYSCALEEDFATLPKGEDSKCGENGASLSGGQRARIALARAVYQNKNIYLLDDVLSAVDVPVVHQIMKRCIHGILVGKTIILVTNHIHVLEKADWIIQMDNGSVMRQGHPDDIFPQLGISKGKTFMVSDDENKLLPQPSSGAIPRQYSKPSLKEVSEIDYKIVEGVSMDDQEEVETRAVGELNVNVYLNYLSAVGVVLSIMIFFSIFLMQTSKNLSDAWLAKWVSQSSPPSNYSAALFSRNASSLTFQMSSLPQVTVSHPYLYYQSESFQGMDPETKFYLTVYSIFAFSNTIFTLIRAFLFAYGGICAAKTLHKRLLEAILNSKLSFFDVNPLGRILNRFSTDIYTMDDSLPFQANIFMAQLFGLLGSLVVTIYVMPWILLLYIPLMFVYYTTQDYYRHTSRDLRRVYALSLSPLYNHFTETLNGISVIRALRAGHRFSVLADTYLEFNQRAQFCLEVVSQWLNLRLQLIGIGILTGVVVMSLWPHHITGVNPGLVGLVISYALTINGFLNGVVSSLTDTEREMISVERITQYLDGASREGESGNNHQSTPVALPTGWPNYGLIKYENVHLKYHSHNPYSLRDVSFEVFASEKIGIVGRTGAGKSSILMALFRLVELTRGRISIDNVDIADISLKRLRSTLAIISQETLIFSGTVRENLDPHGINFDQDIYEAIEKCQLVNLVTQLGGLDSAMESGGDNMSAGQKQLFCMARALLCKTKIVCIDEGTSLLDYETDLQIQSVMRDSFQNKTVMIIAHRLQTIKDCDRVIVMSDGELVEIGQPKELMEDSSSMFHSMFRL